MIKPPTHGRSSAASYSACYYPRMNWTGGVAKWMYAKLLPSEWMNVGKVQNATAAPPINSWKLFPNAISHSPAFLFSIGQRNQHISISTTRISHGVIRRATLHPSEYNRRWNLRDTLDALHCSLDWMVVVWQRRKNSLVRLIFILFFLSTARRTTDFCFLSSFVFLYTSLSQCTSIRVDKILSLPQMERQRTETKLK